MFEPASSSKKPRWYLARAGERHGPIDDAKLFSLAGQDLIAATDLVWRPGFLAWISAGEVPGLLIPPPLPNSLGGRSMPDLDDAPPRLAIVTETNSVPTGLMTSSPESRDAHDEDFAPRAAAADPETSAAEDQATHSLTAASVGWGGKNLEALRDALRSAPNYAP